MKKFPACLLWLLLVAFIFPAAVYPAEGNLIKNPSFEDAGAIQYWSAWAYETADTVFSIDNSEARSGSHSLKITNTRENDGRFRQPITLEEYSIYRYSCWIKTRDVGADRTGANISIEGMLETSPDIRGTTDDWQYVEMYIRTGRSPGTVVLTVGVGGYGNTNTGTAFFDDVELIKTGSIPPGARNAFIEGKAGANAGNYTGADAKRPFWLMMAAAVLAAAAYAYHRLKGKKIIEADLPEDGSRIPDNRHQAAGYRVGKGREDKGLSDKSQRDKGREYKGRSDKSRLDKDRNDKKQGYKYRDGISRREITAANKDRLIMFTMAFIYLVMALIGLGSLEVPETGWTPQFTGESFVVDFGREIELSRISYYCGLGADWHADGVYRVDYRDKNGEYAFLTRLAKNNVFVWKYSDVSVVTDALRITVENHGGTLNELVFFEKGTNRPAEGFEITERQLASSGESAAVENLFDEQHKAAWLPSCKNGTYFDEIYHARTAYEHLNNIEPYENTHPPLGKILISTGIILFGMNPFGWRMMGVLFGAAMIPAMYMFGMKVFCSRFCAFCCAFLMMFDFMHFVQSRIATIDIYAAFFIILMYYFMYDYFTRKSFETGFKKSLKPLFLSGLFFGLGAATKWIALYGAAGLALLFFIAKILEYRDYRQLPVTRKGVKKAWGKDFWPLYMNGTMAMCVLFFVVIPAIIYIMSYIPFPHNSLGDILKYQAHMFRYHSRLSETHSFSSEWWQWPIMTRPVWLYNGSGLPPGMKSTIATFGNPAVWWVGIAACAAAVVICALKHDKFPWYRISALVVSVGAALLTGNSLLSSICTLIAAVIVLAVTFRDKPLFFIFTAISAQYLPWIMVPRIAFIYHYFSIVPFVILCIVYIIKHFMEKYPEAKYPACGYMLFVAALFVKFYPVLSGMTVREEYIESLKWLKTWVF